MYSFPNFKPAHCPKSSSNCCFFTYIRFLRRQVRWFGILISLTIFQFVVIHTVKANEAEVAIFLKFSCIFHDPMDVGNLISGSSGFSKSSLLSGSSRFTYCWSLAWRILSITSLACEMTATMWWSEHLALPFFGTGMKTDPFQSYGHCWVFQICWHIECSTLTASSFRIFNSSARILPSPLALLLVMLSKAHLTSYSRISGSSWITKPSWLSVSLRFFCIVFLCILATSS